MDSKFNLGIFFSIFVLVVLFGNLIFQPRDLVSQLLLIFLALSGAIIGGVLP